MFNDDLNSGYDESMSSFDDSAACENDCFWDINPGSGLPIDDCGGLYIGGYIYGDGPDFSEL